MFSLSTSTISRFGLAFVLTATYSDSILTSLTLPCHQRTVERGPAHLARLEVLATLSQLSQHLTELERQLAAEDHAIHRGGDLTQLADQHRQTVEPLTQLIAAKLADARCEGGGGGGGGAVTAGGGRREA